MSNATCSFQGIFEEQFKTYPFNNTAGISFWHLRSARFGHTNDLQYLIDGTKSQGEDYLRGLLASSILIFSISVGWCILLLAFKWIGPRRVGWLSGRHVPLPPNPGKEEVANGNGNKVEEGPTAWERKYNKIIRTRTIMKALVVVAGIGIIVNAIMLSVKGVKDLIHTLDGIDYVINYSIGLMEEGVALIDSILYTEQQLTNETTAAWDAINGICPELLQPICSNISDVQTCNVTEVLQNDTALVDFLALLTATRNEIYDQLNQSKYDLLDSIAFASSLSDVSQTFNWAFWCSLVFSLATAIISLFFIYRAIRPPTKKKSRCSCRNVFIIPSFVLLVFLSWIFAIVFVIGSIGLADMCYDSPDDNVKALLQRLQSKFSPILYRSVLFYVSGCPLGQAVTEIAVFVSYLAFFFQSAAAAIQSLDFQNVASECGVQSVARAADATGYVSASVCQMADLMREVHIYLECANWYPLYDEGVYQAMCYQGTSGFVWVTSTQIAIVVCSMVILSLRVVFREIDMEAPTESPDSVEDKEACVNAVENQDTKPDEEQAFATVIVAPRDYVPGKDETQVVESVPLSDDDPKEVLTLPLEDSETIEGDNGGVVVLPPISQDARALAGDDIDAQACEPMDDLKAEAGKDVVVGSDLALQEKVLDDAEPMVEEDQAEDVSQDDKVVLPETTEIEQEAEAVTETDATAVESHDEPSEESEVNAEVKDIDGSSPLTENDNDVTKDPSSIDEHEKPQDVDQDNGVLIPDSKEIHEDVVGGENLAATDDQGDASDEAGEAFEDSKANIEEAAVETPAASAENTHGEKDDAPWIVDDVETHHVEKDNAVMSPNSLATEGSSRSVAADEIWLWHTKGTPQATKDANSDDEDLV